MKYLCQLLTIVLALVSNLAIASDIKLTMNSYGPVKIGMTADEAFKKRLELSTMLKDIIWEHK